MNTLLHALLAATKERKMVWHEEAPDTYVGTGPVKAFITCLTPQLFGTDDSEGPQAYKVQIDRLSFVCWEGTDGCEIIRHILESGLPEFDAHMKSIREIAAEIIEKLNKFSCGPHAG